MSRHILNIDTEADGFIAVDVAMIDSVKFSNGTVTLIHRYNGTVTASGLTKESAEQIRTMFSQSRGAENGQGVYKQLSTGEDKASADEGEGSGSEGSSC